MPFLGFGVFVMMQKQMVGLRERAERFGGKRPSIAAPDAMIRRLPSSRRQNPSRPRRKHDIGRSPATRSPMP